MEYPFTCIQTFHISHKHQTKEEENARMKTALAVGTRSEQIIAWLHNLGSFWWQVRNCNAPQPVKNCKLPTLPLPPFLPTTTTLTLPCKLPLHRHGSQTCTIFWVRNNEGGRDDIAQKTRHDHHLKGQRNHNLGYVKNHFAAECCLSFFSFPQHTLQFEECVLGMIWFIRHTLYEARTTHDSLLNAALKHNAFLYTVVAKKRFIKVSDMRRNGL